MIDAGLRPIFRKHLPSWDWQSVETGSTGGGVPDSNYCHDGVEGWLEYKQTTGWAVTLAPDQIGWISRRVRHGGRVHVAVRRRTLGGPRSGPPADQLWLFHGHWAVEARVNGLRGDWAGVGAIKWDGGPSGWNWAEIAALITGEFGSKFGT